MSAPEVVLPVPRSIERYGWRPSLPDIRDEEADTAGLKIAAEVDPRRHMQAPYDQGQLGSCTANAVAAAVEFDMILDGASFGTPSRLAIYWLERFLEGGDAQTKQDSGAYGRDGFRAVQKVGMAPEGDWPYDISRFAADPRYPLSADFEEHKLVKRYRAVPRSKLAWQRVLSNEQTIAFGFTVYSGFESEDVAKSGVVALPQAGERVIGGHEVLAVGYLRDEPDYVLCRNSWGEGWGLGGYFLLPWRYVLNSRLSSDFRTIVR